MNFQETLKHLSSELSNIPYENGDIGDIGNEIGFILGTKFPNLSKEDIKDFIRGFEHGVSLTNGTH